MLKSLKSKAGTLPGLGHSKAKQGVVPRCGKNTSNADGSSTGRFTIARSVGLSSKKSSTTSGHKTSHQDTAEGLDLTQHNSAPCIERLESTGHAAPVSELQTTVDEKSLTTATPVNVYQSYTWSVTPLPDQNNLQKLTQRTSSGHTELSPAAASQNVDLSTPEKLPSHAENDKDGLSRQQDSRPTLEEYCRQRSLTLTSTETSNTEFSITMIGAPSSHFLRPLKEEPEPGSEREVNRAYGKMGAWSTDSDSDSEDITELAIQELESHYNEHLGWEERTLRTTSIWTVSGVLLTPTDPTELQFNCETNKTMSIALATVLHLREVPNDNTSKQIEDYVMKMFECNDDTLRKQWRRASIDEKPQEKLVIHIQSGSGLLTKDASGKSLYVRVGIIEATQQRHPIVKKENLLDWQKEGGIMPTGEIQQTKVKEALEPQWNEQIELSIGLAEKEMLVVEIWDSSDKHMAAPSRVKGLKHLLRKTGNFIGRAFLSLWSLSGRVEGKVLDLCSHSGKHKHGTVTVDLAIERVKKTAAQKNQVSIWEHLQLTHAVVNYEGRVVDQYRKKWNAQLSDVAIMLLDRHAEFSGLSEVHKAAIRLSVLVKYHRMFGIKMSTFSALIEKITALEPEIKTIRASIAVLESKAFNNYWVYTLMADLTELARDIEEVLRNHLTVFRFKDPKQPIEELGHRIKILMKLYSFSPFVDELPSDERNLSELLEVCIQKATTKWIKHVQRELMCDIPEMQLSAFRSLISQQILDHCHRSVSNINPIFEQAGVDYFTHFYLAMDAATFGEAFAKVEIRESLDVISTYELYKAVKEVQKLRKFIEKIHWENLKINTAHELFDSKVHEWVATATDKCRNFIKKAVELDKVVQVTDEVPFSSSAVDSEGFLSQLMKLCDELEWPVGPEAIGIVVSVVRNVCELAIFYVGELFTSLRNEDMFDKQRRFRATEKLCIVLNNMQHMKQVVVNGKFLAQLDSATRLASTTEEPGKGLTKEEMVQGREEEKIIRKHSTTVQGKLMQTTGEDIDSKIADIIRQIVKQMRPDLSRLIEEIWKTKAPTVGLEAMDPLMTYMTSNIQTLHKHLVPCVFQLILRDVWRVCNDCLLTFLESGASKKDSTCEPTQYYNNLKFVLQSFKHFFYADGGGVSQDALETENHKELSYQLDILSLPTDGLILRFFSDLADIQMAKAQTAAINPKSAKLGSLLLTIGYHQDREVIEVNLIKGKDLPGLDNSGLIDRYPYVKLALMPPWYFGHRHTKRSQYRTTVRKQTVNPVYNEDFIIPASKQTIQVKGAVLLFIINYHELIGTNSLCGICIVPCKDIPHLSSVRSAFDDPNAIERKNLTLPLFKISNSETNTTLKELTSRANSSDPKATEFLKNNKHILSDSEPDIVLPHQKLREFLKKQ